MLRKIFFLVVLFATTSIQQLAAQKATLKLSPEIEQEKGVAFVGHLHSDETGHYLLSTKFKAKGVFSGEITPILEKYDLNWNRTLQKEYTVTDENLRFEGFHYIKKGFLMGTSKVDEDAQKIQIFTTRIGLDGTAAKPKELSSLSYNPKMGVPLDSWAISNDSLKLVLALRMRVKPDERQPIQIFVTDFEGNEIWSKSILMPYIQKRMSITNWKVDDQGNVYMIVKSKLDPGEPGGGKGDNAGFRYEIYRYSAEGEMKDATN